MVRWQRSMISRMTLQNFATAFLEGHFEEFATYAAKAEQWKKIPGIARLP
jgi:hypothetical protein